MGKHHVIVKYFSRRMLGTVDLHTLFITLFDAYGDDVTVEFVAMDEAERRGASDEPKPIPIIRDRFQVFEISSPAEARRRPDIEAEAIRAGQK